MLSSLVANRNVSCRVSPLARTLCTFNTRQRNLRIRNGSKVHQFSNQEMERRIGNLRKTMEDNDIDGVLMTSYHNIKYYSGFMFTSMGRKYGLYVTQDSHTTISAAVDGGQPWRMSYDDNIVYTDWQRDNYEKTVASLMNDHHHKGQVTKFRLGLEFDHINMSLVESLKAAVPCGVSVVDVAGHAMRQRMVKSREEIALTRDAARIADVGGAACRNMVQEGVPEYEIALASNQAMIREIANTYPQYEIMDTWTWFQSGINTDGAHNPITTRRLQLGDVLILNCFPLINNYYAALERTLFLGQPSSAALNYWEKNVQVHRRGLELIKPGARCSDIANELNAMFAQWDLVKYRTFGYGHSIGVLSHFYGREAALELREDIDTVLEPGMLITMEPMVTIPEGMEGAGGYREHDILIVTESGAENITNFPLGPEHNIISPIAEGAVLAM